MWDAGLYDPEIRDGSIYFFADGTVSQQPKIGHMRIRFFKYPCDSATIIAQQKLANSGEFTFGTYELDK